MVRHLSPALPRRSLFRWLSALGLGSMLPAARAATPDPATPWHAFCDRLKEAGDQILRPEAPQDPFNRAEGYRYLSRLLRAALEQEVECSDPQFPVLYQLSNETIKIGADNPDNFYQNAQIDGRYDYRIRGSRGTVNYMVLSTKAGSYGKSSSLQHTGAIDTTTLQVAPNGGFEILLSAARKPGNWLPMSAESSMLLVRQTFLDRGTEKPAALEIECLNGPARPAPLTPSDCPCSCSRLPTSCRVRRGSLPTGLSASRRTRTRSRCSIRPSSCARAATRRSSTRMATGRSGPTRRF